MTEREIYKQAKKKVKLKKEFYTHFAIYCATILFLFTINYLTGPNFLWFLFPALGWGIGIVAHYFSAFGLPSKDGDWEEKEIEKEMQKLERKSLYQRFPNKDNDITLPDDELELKEFKKLRREWDDQDLV